MVTIQLERAKEFMAAIQLECSPAVCILTAPIAIDHTVAGFNLATA
jgi:hypothetical protein